MLQPVHHLDQMETVLGALERAEPLGRRERAGRAEEKPPPSRATPRRRLWFVPLYREPSAWPAFLPDAWNLSPRARAVPVAAPALGLRLPVAWATVPGTDDAIGLRAMTRQRSPALLQRDRSALVVIDMQERLMPAIADADAVTRAAGILIEASRQLEVPVVVTEQYPKGLGPTVDAIASRLPNGAAVVEKMTFSAARNFDFASRIDELRAAGRDHIVLCGVESHVCVMQTAADLGAEGCIVHIVADACSSRAPASKEAALARFGALGISRVTTEMVLFEWLEAAGTPEFKAVSRLVK